VGVDNTGSGAGDENRKVKDITEEITDQPEENKGILNVYDVSEENMYLYYDLTEERLLIVEE